MAGGDNERARGSMCARCGLPLWDPNRQRLRKHGEKQCAAERARVDAEFAEAERKQRPSLWRMDF